MQIDFHEAFLPSYIPLALVNLCLAEKIREDMIFSGLNLELADLKQHQPLSYSEMNILVENCLNALTFSPLSLKVAHSLDLEHMGALGQALINCPSFKEALHCLERYCVLIDPALWFKTEQCPQHIVLRFRKMIPLGQIYQYSQEVIAVSVLRLCSMLFQLADIRLDFEFSRPAYARQFNTLPCQIQWQQSETRLIFPIKALACAGNSAHQQRFHEAVQQCEREFQSFYKQQKCWIFRVLSLIHIYPLVKHIIDRDLVAHGASAISLLTAFMNEWFDETQPWVNSVIKTTAAESEENRQQILAWIEKWQVQAQTVAISLLKLVDADDSDVALIDEIFTKRLSKIGLIAKEAAA